MADIEFLRAREYKDLAMSFGINPVTNDVLSVTGVEAVKRAIKNLLSMNEGEVPFYPNLGSGIHELLFEPMDAITMSSLEHAIRAVIEAFEPRVRIERLDIRGSADELQYTVDITIRLLNLATPVTFSVFLKRLR